MSRSILWGSLGAADLTGKILNDSGAPLVKFRVQREKCRNSVPFGLEGSSGEYMTG